jgi:hypothetical protein
MDHEKLFQKFKIEILVGVGTLILALLAEHLLNHLKFTDALIAGAYVILVLIIIVFVVAFVKTKTIEAILIDLAERYKLHSMFPQIEKYYQEKIIISEVSMSFLEEETIASEIIIASANLEHDKPAGLFVKIVKENLKRIKYIYVVPETKEIKANVARMKEEYDNSENLKFAFIDHNKFDNITATNIVVFHFSQGKYLIYQEMPIDKDPNNRCWCKVDQNLAGTYYGTIRDLINGAVKKGTID